MIMEKVGTAECNLYFCILAFTQYQLAEAMKSQRDLVPGLEVRGVFDDGIEPYETGYSQYYPLSGDEVAWNYWSPPADVWLDTALGGSVLLHHKYMLVDANSLSNAMVITGSHNWSYSADTANDENTLVIRDRTISNLFLQEFAQRYHESGGTGELVGSSGVPGDSRDVAPHSAPVLRQNYPNPFSASTTLSFENGSAIRASLKIYDTSGRLVRTLLESRMVAPGAHYIGWDSTDDRGNDVASGLYFYRLEGGGASAAKKMLLLK
jgi:hypothetical protein